jgi:hypothetical protein
MSNTREFFIDEKCSLDFKIIENKPVYYSFILESDNYSKVFKSENSVYDKEYAKSLNQGIGMVISPKVINERDIQNRFPRAFKNALKKIKEDLKTRKYNTF